jgi:hypothetical protein
LAGSLPLDGLIVSVPELAQQAVELAAGLL